MKAYIHKGTLSNLANLVVGASLFFYSFHIGESTLLGGIFHLGGCGIFCCGIHGRWCKDTCEENKCCEPGESK
jgi:hypothetical protein